MINKSIIAHEIKVAHFLIKITLNDCNKFNPLRLVQLDSIQISINKTYRNLLCLQQKHMQKHRKHLTLNFNRYTRRVYIRVSKFFQMNINGSNLRGHDKKLFKGRCRLEIRRNFFSQRVVDHWNSLPQEVIDAESVNGFKRMLDKYLDPGL